MNRKSIVRNDVIFKQDFSKDGHNLQKDIFNYFITDLIQSNATYKHGRQELDVSDLSYEDKKLFLSYLLDIDDFEYYTKNKRREKAAIDEYSQWMQEEIDHRIDDIYHKNMEEMGLKLCQHHSNGEQFWIIR